MCSTTRSESLKANVTVFLSHSELSGSLQGHPAKTTITIKTTTTTKEKDQRIW